MAGGRIGLSGALVLRCTLDQHVGAQPEPPFGSGPADDVGAEDTGEDPPRLDVEESRCEAPPPVTCDALDDDPFRAMGLDCPGGAPVHVEFDGHPDAVAVVGALGDAGVFVPQEGEKMTVLSTGIAPEIALTPEEIAARDPESGACNLPTDCPSTWLGGHDHAILPPPIQVQPVHETLDCLDDPALVGQGDCSNTLWSQWHPATCPPDQECTSAADYVELQVRARVPEGATGLSVRFAFGSIEYPNFWQSVFNDMFVVWLESEAWTGNISFDDLGRPISLNAGFLDFKDAIPTGGCPDDCTAPELHGFALEGHAATRWLESSAGLRSRENIQVVMALFDLSDGLWDSYVLLDGFAWTCSGEPPTTRPIP
jgi:hypothetical protein